MATLRAPTNADAPALSRLLAELGYPADAEDIPARLKALQGHPGAVAVVAEVHGRVVGLATVHVIPSIHMSAPVAWLTTLVVSEGARGSGVGRELVAHAEAFAAARGASKISLTSALHRDRAHSFYKSLGYEQTGVRLAKTLSP